MENNELLKHTLYIKTVRKVTVSKPRKHCNRNLRCIIRYAKEIQIIKTWKEVVTLSYSLMI
jgi:hypothetical protein